MGRELLQNAFVANGTKTTGTMRVDRRTGPKLKSLYAATCYLGATVEQNGELDNNIVNRISAAWAKWRQACGQYVIVEYHFD